MESWEPADRLLYKFCRKNSKHDDRPAVYSMVFLIDRTYATQLARTAGRAAEDIYDSLADGLLGRHEDVTLLISTCRGLGMRFQLTHIEKIIKAHGRLRELLSQMDPALKKTSLDSFASKYLHFHAPVIPILDSRSEEQATNQCHLHDGPKAESRRLRAKPIAEKDGRYPCFLYRWWCLLRQAREQGLLPSAQWPHIPDTKFMDVYLWSSR